MDKLSKKSTHDLTNLVIEIDNGIMDSFCEKHPNCYKYCDKIRQHIINILVKRYAEAIEINNHVTYSLRHSYNVLLKYYL